MKSASMVKERGAVGTADYNSETCVQDIKKAANGAPIKHALDCITEPDSVEVCFNAMARVGGRYACLEACPEAWRPKRAVKVKVVMGFESRGVDVDIGHPVYARKANPKLFDMACRWTTEMQILLDKGQITTQAYQEVHGGFEGIIESMEMLHAGKVKGRKLVVRLGGL
jgi:NADPH:quinone reductase-like Zn-dependent oxidoreductase